jgi:hypothetical protein
MSKIADAHKALFETLKGAASFSFASVNFNEALPAEPPQEPWLNVVLAPGRAELLAEVLGLGEDLVVEEFAQVYHLEWVVRREDPTIREQLFEQGFAAIQAALHADRTLGGVARGLKIGPADRANHRYAFIPTTAAANIPVRVLLSGPSAIG